jgi:hypothetical protein
MLRPPQEQQPLFESLLDTLKPSQILKNKWILSTGFLLLSFSSLKLVLRWVRNNRAYNRQQKVDLLLRNVNSISCEQSLIELLDISIKKYLHEYSSIRGPQSNHLPGCLIAVQRLLSRYPVSVDENEQYNVSVMKRFFITYEPRLTFCPDDRDKYLLLSGKVIFEENVECNRLIIGISGADFYPFIQYAYGILINHELTQNDAIQYMQLAYQSLEQQNTSTKVSEQIDPFQKEYYKAIEDFDVIELLNAIKKVFGKVKLPKCKGMPLSHRLHHLATKCSLFQQLHAVTFVSDHLPTNQLIEKLTTCTLLMLIEQGVRDYSYVKLVCLVHAARVVIDSHKLSDDECGEWELLRQVWLIILATYMTNSMSPQLPTSLNLETKGILSKDDIPEWGVIIRDMVAHITDNNKNGQLNPDLEHKIELIFSCEDQARVFPKYDLLFRYIAAESLKKA